MVLVTVALLLTSVAFASPPDPTRVGEFLDDGDFDGVVIRSDLGHTAAARRTAAIPARKMVDQPPIRIVVDLLREAPTPAEPLVGSLPHAPRSPPAPAR